MKSATIGKKSFKRHKAGLVWDRWNTTQRGNWLQSRDWKTSYAWDTWWHLPETLRRDFVQHVKISRSIYAYA